MPNDDVKTLREAAFACTIRYANTHMSTNDRLYFDAIKICFNRMADMIEREGAPNELSIKEEWAWNAAVTDGTEAVKRMLDKFPDGITPGTYTDGYVSALYDVMDALAALRREPRT